jgi:xanthine dehydrogenase accessory factor
LDILGEILFALSSEERVMLATIISTSGSTPASAFSKMLVKEGGKSWIGTVGGGCMEGDVLEQAIRLYGSGRAEIMTFHLNEDDIPQGLTCGGSLDVLIEPLTRTSIPLIRELQTLVDDGEDCIIATFLGDDGSVRSKQLVRFIDGAWTARNAGEWKEPSLKFPEFAELLQKVHQRNETRRTRGERGELILEPVVGHPGLIIFGGGHVSKYISRAAATAGFRVTIVDDRKEYANSQRFPEASQTLVVEFSEAFRQLTIKPSTYIVIVTRGHRFDEQVLEQAIGTPARYIGMIGSKRKVLRTYEHLVERGISVNLFKRVHAPMGLDIGAVTAEEIGISVVAQLIQVRRNEGLSIRHKSEAMNELVAGLEARFTVVRDSTPRTGT